jgi:hypothetical protein
MLDTLTKPTHSDAVSVPAQRILALDLGAEISWAVRARDGGVICGTDSYRSKQVQTSGIRFLRFRNWLHELRAEGVQAIVYRENTSAQFRVWVPHLTEFVNRAGLPMRGISSGAIKRPLQGAAARRWKR